MTDFLLKKRPNIVLIMCDQMRGDCLGIAGHPDVKTPYLVLSLQKALIFQMHTVPVLAAFPARAALFTGLSQEHHHRVVIRMVLPGSPHMLSCCLVQMEAITRKWIGKSMCIHHYTLWFSKHDPS